MTGSVPGDLGLHYTTMPLMRHLERCQDPKWLEEQMALDHSRVMPIWKDKNLFHIGTSPCQPAILSKTEAASLAGHASEIIYLGHEGIQPMFAVDLSALAADRVQQVVDQVVADCQFMDLRRVSIGLPAEQASLLAYARGLAVWHRNHGYCAYCGHRTRSKRGGHIRQCENCGREHFPRIDPAVIMLVVHADRSKEPSRCLLGRNSRLPNRVYSTLAGYVDPGETLEQAVAREVWEEASIRAFNIRYIASQPWPFPGSLMIGFRADSEGGEPDTSTNELEDARWFTAAEVRLFREFGQGRGEELELPRRDSIARLLIEQWLHENH